MLNSLRRALEPLIRPLMHVFWRLTRGMTLGARAVVIDAQGRVFLVQHSYTDGWHLPGGGVEHGESAPEALRRELREEGNIELTGTPRLYGFFHNPGNLQRDHIALFVVREFRQDVAPVATREISAHGFFRPDELPSDTSRATRARIAEVLNGTPPASERW
jgi:ADP-ribose pyrophosphatase YjhB (NUDIX family)